MLDIDTQRFAEGLSQTRPGLRLRLAMNEGRIAIHQIERLKQLGGSRMNQAIESWRRAYIKASDRAAEAIDELWDRHSWPADGARNRRYEWRPAKDFRRPV
jgi:hypothetical protein